MGKCISLSQVYDMITVQMEKLQVDDLSGEKLDETLKKASGAKDLAVLALNTADLQLKGQMFKANAPVGFKLPPMFED